MSKIVSWAAVLYGWIVALTFHKSNLNHLLRLMHRSIEAIQAWKTAFKALRRRGFAARRLAAYGQHAYSPNLT
jgi:hypothetical protein